MARLRLARIACMTFAAASLLPACLITDSLDEPRELNLPPAIVSSPAAATLPIPTDLESIVSVDLQRDAPEGGPGEVVLPVEVRDPNLEQALFYRFFVDFDAELNATSPISGDRIPPSGELARDLTVTVPFSALGTAGRCHKLELRVSSAFVDPLPQYDPVDAEDLAVAVWWLRLTDEVHPTVDLSTCP